MNFFFFCSQQKVDLPHLKDIHLGSDMTHICCLRLYLRVLDLNGGMFRFHSDQKNIKHMQVSPTSKEEICLFMLKLSQTKISGAFDYFSQIVTEFRISHGLKSIFYHFCSRPHVGISTSSHILLCLITCDWQFYPQESQIANYLSDCYKCSNPFFSFFLR